MEIFNNKKKLKMAKQKLIKTGCGYSLAVPQKENVLRFCLSCSNIKILLKKNEITARKYAYASLSVK